MNVLLTWPQSTFCCVKMKGEGPRLEARALKAAASPPSFPGPWLAHCLPAQATCPCSPEWS